MRVISSTIYGEVEKYDAIIIGLGLTGSFAAKELANSGLKIAALDAGPLLKDDFFNYDWAEDENLDLKANIYRLRTGLFPDYSRSSNKALVYRAKSIYLNEKDSPFSTLENQKFQWSRARIVGGRGHVWGRVCPRFTKEEFELSNNEHDSSWPIDLKDIEQFYEEVETTLLLGGEASRSGRMADGCFIKKRSLNKMEEKLGDAIQEKWPERIFDTNHIMEYKPSPLSPMLESALKTKNITIKSNSIVKKIITDRDGIANGVEYIDTKLNTENQIKSDIIILSASPFESIRILKSSISSKHPTGIGNSSNLLGKYIFDHVKADYYNILPRELWDSQKENSRLNPFKPNLDPHGFYITPFTHLEKDKIDFKGRYAAQGYISGKQKLFSFDVFGEMAPRIENKIEISTHEKDKWGIPLPKIHFKYSNNEIKMWHHQMKFIKSIVTMFQKTCDIKLTSTFRSQMKDFFSKQKVPIAGRSSHEMGGARMGTNPKESIVNEYNRVWDSPNILVCDASCFPSAGYQNIALTSMALSIRACKNISKAAKYSKMLRSL